VATFTSIAEFTAAAAAAADAAAGDPWISDVIADVLERAAAANATWHIYTRTLDARALHAAASGTRPSPLRGVPVAIKDNIDVEGEHTSCGRRLTSPPAVTSAAIVKRLESLGAVVIGKTNLDEAALGASGRNPRFGRCHNPRFADCLSGGSSSGSAAAVAAGHALLGVGTDTLGSVRIPAAFCGVAGFKPSHGRLPLEGVAPLYPRFDSVGLIAASLSDISLVAGALLGEDTPQQPRQSGTRDAATFAANACEISVLDDGALEAVDTDVADGYRRCVQVLRGSRAAALSDAPRLDWIGTARAGLWEVAHEFAARSAGGAAGRSPGYHSCEDIDGDLGRLLARAASLPAARLATGTALLEESRRALTQCLRGSDALLTPTCPQNAPRLDENPANHVAAFVAPANVAGLPAVAWPQRLGRGHTVSLQLIGRYGEDLRLLDLALQLQRLLG